MLGPASYKESVLRPGEPDALTVFQLPGPGRVWRFVTPICFEDIDAGVCSAMFRPQNAGGKRADFLVNLTNDGWFKANENAQHLQAAIFRSIENRVFSARSVNTGISGFIDSTGQTSHLLPVRQEGTAVAQVMLDSRLSIYTRCGDFFAWLCVAVLAALALFAWWTKPRHPSKQKFSQEKP
jgi:apolipoprotein N-acyltransferase